MILKPLSTYSLLFLLFSVLTAGLLWAGDYPIETRVVTIRYFLFALAGFTAFSTPYLIFPDKLAAMLQLGNVNGRKMAQYIMSKTIRVQWPIPVLLTVITFGDIYSPVSNLGTKTFYLIFSLSLYIGLVLAATSRYVRSGTDSQFWQETERGREMRKKFADYFKYPLDPGTIPSMINTLIISAAGMIAVVLGAWLGSNAGAASEAIVGIAVFVTGTIMFVRLGKNPEKNYYPTNAFFEEFFGTGNGEDSVVERRKVEQLWWVPDTVRVHTWQFLQQIDRRIPAGRVVAVGHALVWFIAYQRPGEGFMTALWLLFAVAHQLLILLTLQPSMSPGWLLRWIGPLRIWFMSRFWMQMRWLVPLLISMNIQLFILGFPTPLNQAWIIAIFLLSAALGSAVGVLQLKKDIQ